MAILIGLILLALGISLAVVWWGAFVTALKGVLVLSLLFWGAIVTLIGYSEMKARREYAAAISDDVEESEEIQNGQSIRT